MDYHVYIIITCLVALDYITGIVAGCMESGFDSAKMREGLLHKLTYLVAILTCLCIEWASMFLEMGFMFGSGITAMVCVWISITEIGSILENICRINPELAQGGFMELFKKKGE